MRERPILFSSTMIRAILDGSKTQTRRVIKPQPTGPFLGLLERPLRSDKDAPVLRAWFQNDPSPSQEITCPYGKSGDRLWVRETWREGPSGALYRATDDDGTPAVRWKPSIHMPRTYSRLILEIVSIKVERVREISEADARVEGVRPDGRAGVDPHKYAFKRLWNEINSKRGFGWDVNPWVWVIGFKRVD